MKKKTLTIAIALVLVVALAVGATWAYLTATAGPVENTFAVGNVIDKTKFTLQEHQVKYDDTTGLYVYVLNDGEKQPATTNTYNKLVPGTTAPKDPFITIGEETQAPAYLFVKVTDTSAGITYSVDTNKWAEVSSGINGLKDGEKVYVYKVGSDNVLPLGSSGDYAILTGNQISVGSNVSTISGGLVFNGYLCQAAGFQSATDAFNQCFGTTTGA